MKNFIYGLLHSENCFLERPLKIVKKTVVKEKLPYYEGR